MCYDEYGYGTNYVWYNAKYDSICCVGAITSIYLEDVSFMVRLGVLD